MGPMRYAMLATSIKNAWPEVLMLELRVRADTGERGKNPLQASPLRNVLLRNRIVSFVCSMHAQDVACVAAPASVNSVHCQGGLPWSSFGKSLLVPRCLNESFFGGSYGSSLSSCTQSAPPPPSSDSLQVVQVLQ